MHLSPDTTSELAILSRVFGPKDLQFSPAAARAILALDFSPDDKERMQGLAARARAGALTPAEEVAINNYERIGHLLNILQSKARRSLKQRGADGKRKPH